MSNFYNVLIINFLSITLFLFSHPLPVERETEPMNVQGLAQELIHNDIEHWKVVLAQGIIESGWNFDSPLYTNTNNFVGMRIPRARQSTRIGEYKAYSTYSCWQDCVTDIKYWQEQNWEAGTQEDYIRFVDKHWAESPVYAAALRKVISRLERMADNLVSEHHNHFKAMLIAAYLGTGN